MKNMIHTLPDIHMYGGDTTPWEVTPQNEQGELFDSDTLHGCLAVLEIAPCRNTMTGWRTLTDPIIRKEGVVNGQHFLFEFTEEDTFSLNGEYVYQIRISNGDDVRYCQGVLRIRDNIRKDICE